MPTETKHWTLEELHRLPDDDDGNTYELANGELWVTPAPTDRHETIRARLARVLDPYVEAEGVRLVYRARAVFRVGRDVEVEPDLMVRQPHPDPDGTWETAPRPILVVEVVWPSTRRRDYEKKRDLYVAQAIPEYWIVDDETRTLTVAQPGRDAVTVADAVTWAPPAARTPLTFPLSRVFG